MFDVKVFTRYVLFIFYFYFFVNKKSYIDISWGFYLVTCLVSFCFFLLSWQYACSGSSESPKYEGYDGENFSSVFPAL